MSLNETPMKIFCVRHWMHWCIQDEVKTVYFSAIKRNLKEQGECVENIANFAKIIEKSKYYERSLIVVLVIFLKKTACLHL